MARGAEELDLTKIGVMVVFVCAGSDKLLLRIKEHQALLVRIHQISPNNLYRNFRELNRDKLYTGLQKILKKFQKLTHLYFITTGCDPCGISV